MANKNEGADNSIQSTRKKKMDEFAMNFDQSVMHDEFEDFDDGFDEISSRRSSKRNREINSYSDDDTKARIEKESMKALKKQQKEEKKIERKKAKHNKRMFRWLWVVMVLFVAVVLSQIIMVAINDMLAISRESNKETVSVSIPKDATIDDIAKILGDSGVIERPYYFALYANLTSSADGFRQGEFDIPANKDYEAIINYLQSNNNRKDIMKVQITEGMNVLEIANLLHEKGVIYDVQEFLDAANSDDFDEEFTFLKDIKNASDRYYKLEGYLFPDTYEFYAGEDPKDSIEKMLNNFENRIVYTEDKYFGHSKKSTLAEEMNESSYTMDEILTIASIIQAEAASEDDMYYISSIIRNRLNYGSDVGINNLGLDCTVYYPYREKEDVPEAIRDTYDSNYDTNNFSGLPPGPICNPSLEAIKAALNPNDTDYMFFCHASADDGSTPYYATTLSEHEYNLSLISGDSDSGSGDDYYE